MPTKIVLAERGEAIDSLEEGIEATVRLIDDPELAGDQRQLLRPPAALRGARPGQRPEARRRLWELSLELVGEPDPFA